MEAFELDQIQGDGRDAGEPARLGDDLIAEQVRRHRVEHLGDVERRRSAGELAGGRSASRLVGVRPLRRAPLRGFDELGA